MRHSCAHVMAARSCGCAKGRGSRLVDGRGGFYYDFDVDEPLKEEDFRH